MKRDGTKEKSVILNQPITSEENDWIGVSVYVDKLDEAIKSGAGMIGITSDFGAGKSSLVSLLKNRYPWWKRQRARLAFYTINMWNNLDAQTGEQDSGCGENNSVSLHKSFLFHLISQISPTKGSYISKRLSRNYGLLKVQSSSRIHMAALCIAVIMGLFAEALRRFGTETGFFSGIPFFQRHGLFLQFMAYAVAAVCIVYVVCKADILFSSTKSEGKRQIDENILIDYYHHEVLYRGFFRHYVFIIEDLDRTDNADTVLRFLKEIRKYYLTSENFLSRLHHNRVTFIINIKPEALLENPGRPPKQADTLPAQADARCPAEGLYSKFSDYTIELTKINIDNYDVILNGQLHELSHTLVRLGLIGDAGSASVDAIPGMQWIIRGRKLDMREIKERLNKALTLYESLLHKFSKNEITFEKCAAATYLTSEYAREYYRLADDDLEGIIEKYMRGELTDGVDTWPGRWEQTSPDFKQEVLLLIKNKQIDSTYRTYFYHYPKGSHLYNLSETIVFNAIIYNEKPSGREEFERHLREASDETIKTALNKVDKLGLELPQICLTYQRLFEISLIAFREGLWNLIRDLDYGESGIAQTAAMIERFLHFKIPDTVFDQSFAQRLSELWNEIPKSSLAVIRRMLCRTCPQKILWYGALFRGANAFISIEEAEALPDLDCIMPLLNYGTMEEHESCEYLHERIKEQKRSGEDVNEFYQQIADQFGLEDGFTFAKEYCLETGVQNEFMDAILNDAAQQQAIEAADYVDVMEQLPKLSESNLKTLDSIGWYGGLSSRLCSRLYERGYYLCYVCNAALDPQIRIAYENPALCRAILNSAAYIRENCPQAWETIRKQVLMQRDVTEHYRELFAPENPVISKEELNLVEDVGTAIRLLTENVLTEKEIPYVADYFNAAYRNPGKTYDILQYVMTLPKPQLSYQLFYLLNMNQVRYRAMRKERKKEILDLFRPIGKLDKDGAENLKFMRHVGEAIPELEKDLYAAWESDKELEKQYVNFLNSLDAVSSESIHNIVQMDSIYPCGTVITEELFRRKKYLVYISAKTNWQKKFEMEPDRMEELWASYVEIFFSDAYENTRRYMAGNRAFINEMARRKEFSGAGEKLLRFMPADQTKELLEEAAGGTPEIRIKYLSGLHGFASYEAAEYCTNLILSDPKLLASDDVYHNVYDKLINGGLKGKYTKARNRAQT